MHKPIIAIVAASLLLLSSNATAIMMNDHIYGSSGYSLNDIDAGIQAFQDNASGKKDRRHLKKARRFDRHVERLVYKVDNAMVSGNDRKLRRKNKRLIRKEERLLAILADYLPNLDELLQIDSLLATSNILFTGDIPPPQPDTLLSQLNLVTTPVRSNPDGNTLPGTVTTFEASSGEIASVPEPSMFALLGLGFAGLMFHRRRWRQ